MNIGPYKGGRIINAGSGVNQIISYIKSYNAVILHL